MQTNSTNLFRPTLLVLASLAASAVIAVFYAAVFPPTEGPDEVDRLAARISGVEYPSTILDPGDVVRIQLNALADEDGGRGALQCMCFASPANRAITGPFERFGRMLRQPPFMVLTSPDKILVGQPTLVGGTARVFVSIVNRKRVYAFVWVLKKQSLPPFVGCWMTEAVFPVNNGPQEPGRQKIIYKTTSESGSVT